LYNFVARKKIKYIFKFSTERAHRKTPKFSLKELVELRYDQKLLLGFFWITLYLVQKCDPVPLERMDNN
jgi:hypothetical protein